MFVQPKIEQIKAMRKALGWSQHQLSIKAGLSGCAVCRIESGKTAQIHSLRAKEIAKVLNCNVDDIFTKPKGE